MASRYDSIADIRWQQAQIMICLCCSLFYHRQPIHNGWIEREVYTRNSEILYSSKGLHTIIAFKRHVALP